MSMTPPTLTCAHALFLDFDGTLTPIQDNPDSVALPAGGDAVIKAVAADLGGALAIISGRDIRDLAKRTPDDVWRVGNHGMSICAPHADLPEPAPAPDYLRSAAAAVAKSFRGARLEEKGAVLTIHYRAAPDAGDKIAARLAEIIRGLGDYRIERGKMVIELKPLGANKGVALRSLMNLAPFAGRTPYMVGDDTTDEAAMEAALELGGVAVKVGEGDSAAPYKLDAPRDVWNWLKAARL